MRLLELNNGAARLVILLVAALTLGLVALTSATASNGQVPFKARLSVTAAFTSATTVEFHGAETLTAADGDELVIRMVNVGCPDRTLQ